MTENIIIIDWGTTNFRAYLLDDEDRVLEKKESAKGIQFLCHNDFENSLLECVESWISNFFSVSIIAFGMVTSRSGWIEVPYESCPVKVPDLARNIKMKLDIMISVVRV